MNGGACVSRVIPIVDDFFRMSNKWKKNVFPVNSDLIFYHATSTKNYESIKTNGLLTSKHGTGASKDDEEFASQSKGKIHLTDLYTVALHYAYFLKCRKNETPLIFSVKVPIPDFKNIKQDPHDPGSVTTEANIPPDRITLISKEIKISEKDCLTLWRGDAQNIFYILENDPGKKNEANAVFKNCESTFNGKVFGKNKEYCATTIEYFTLGNKNSTGDEFPFSNCEKDFQGKTYGVNSEFCAVMMKYSILGDEVLSDGKNATCKDCETKFFGKVFGPHGEFCATLVYQKLLYSGVTQPVTAAESSEKFEGVTYGDNNEFCAVKRSLHQKF